MEPKVWGISLALLLQTEHVQKDWRDSVCLSVSQRLYRAAVEEVPVGDYQYQLGVAEVRFALLFLRLIAVESGCSSAVVTIPMCASKRLETCWSQISLFSKQIVKEGKDVTVVGWGPQIYVLEKAIKLAEEQGNLQHTHTRSSTSNKQFDFERNLLWAHRPPNTVAMGCWHCHKERWEDGKVRNQKESFYSMWCLLIIDSHFANRLVVSHEAPVTNGFGAEVVAKIQERCFLRYAVTVYRKNHELTNNYQTRSAHSKGMWLWHTLPIRYIRYYLADINWLLQSKHKLTLFFFVFVFLSISVRKAVCSRRAQSVWGDQEGSQVLKITRSHNNKRKARKARKAENQKKTRVRH